MALVTRCPNCASVFRVTPQHLQMQEGNVRCGNCLQIFNSFADLATLQELEADKSLELSCASKEAKKDTQKVLAAEASAVTNTEEQKSYAFEAIQPTRISRLWGLVNIFLLVALAGQAIYLYREELSVFVPSARPYLEQYCEILNCEIPVPQQTELLSIESSDMQKGTASPPQGVTTLTVVIRNQATFPQLFPSLELTLTDTRDRALASRIFTPSEYFEENKHLSDTIEPNKEVSITLKIDSGDLNAAGYRLLLLYH